MSNSRLEFIVGIIVLIVAGMFLYYAMQNRTNVELKTYSITASFTDASGIELGSVVRISGVEVGKVTNFHLDHEIFNAEVEIAMSNSVKLPNDSSAKIVSAGLLGEKFIAITPGIEEEYLQKGDSIGYTQSSLSFEEMLSKLLFGLANDKEK